MSFETMFNQDVREAFKKSIDYPMQVARRPQEKIVLLDWQNALQKIADSEGTVWTGKIDEPTIGQSGEGQLHATMQSDKGAAVVDIIALSGDWKQRLDYVVAAEAMTHRDSVNLKVVQGIEDLYMVPKDFPDITFVSFLYGNFYIKISHWEEQSVAALAKAIYQMMKDNSKAAAAAKTCFKTTADKNQLTVGDTLTIKVEGLVQHWDSQWIYNQPQKLLADELEYIEQNDNVFIFKALKKGTIPIHFSAMNKQTLFIQLQSVTVEIK